MRFPAPSRATPRESIVPMINVVFLLLIFFLMTAQIAPPEPFEVTPPQAEALNPAEGSFTLYLGADGQLAYRDASGLQNVLATLRADHATFCEKTPCPDGPPPVNLRADATMPAERLAALLPHFQAAGIAQLQLITIAP